MSWLHFILYFLQGTQGSELIKSENYSSLVWAIVIGSDML